MLRISDRSSFHRHRWDFLLRRRYGPALPVELWEQILDHVLYVPFFLDTTFVRPQDFYLFVESRSFEHEPRSYNQSENERKRLQLVCRSWNTILSRKSERWAIVSLLNGLSISKGAKRVEIVGSLDGKAQKFQWENAYSTSIIAYWGREYDASLTEWDLSVLFERVANSQAVRSFTYVIRGGPLPLSFPQNLETYFSTLTSLTLTCSKLSGKLHLPNLTTLDLAVLSSSIDITEWWFPSLRHIAFNFSGIPRIHNAQLHQPFIPGPVDKLQSLVLVYWDDRLYANDSFWTSYPSLQFLGIRSQAFIILSNPPSNHPLAHIHCLENHWDLDFHKVTDAAFRIPNLQTITIQDGMDMYMTTTDLYHWRWPELYDTCRQKGIRWFNRRGEELHERGRLKGWQGLKALFQKL